MRGLPRRFRLCDSPGFSCVRDVWGTLYCSSVGAKQGKQLAKVENREGAQNALIVVRFIPSSTLASVSLPNNADATVLPVVAADAALLVVITVPTSFEGSPARMPTRPTASASFGLKSAPRHSPASSSNTSCRWEMVLPPRCTAIAFANSAMTLSKISDHCGSLHFILPIKYTWYNNSSSAS
jgi:hypothetical protein